MLPEFYTLFTFEFTMTKTPTYNTEKKLSFVDVFSGKFTNYFRAKEVHKNVWQPSFIISD